MSKGKDEPSWGWVVLFVGIAAALVVAGVLLLLRGMTVVGVALLVLGMIVPVLVYVIAGRLLLRFLGARPDVEKGGQLGEFLGEGGDVAVRNLSPGLGEDELRTIEANRAAEADATFWWMAALPGGWDFEDVELNADDGAQLVGHVLRCCSGSDRWLVFVHGLDGCWRHGLAWARHYAEMGFNLLLVELRAHGASGGDWVGSGWLDRRDLVSWCQWLVLREGRDTQIVLAGVSMGGATVLEAAGEEDLPRQVCACVADSAYADFWRVALLAVAQAGDSTGRRIPAKPVLEVARLVLLLKRGGYDLAKARPVQAISHAQAPVLLIHGDEDRAVPAFMADELAAAAGGAAEGSGHALLKVHGAGHISSVFADPDAYWASVREFLARWL